MENEQVKQATINGYVKQDILFFTCPIITLEEPHLYIFPKSKSERISFKAYNLFDKKQVSIIATRNVKYYLKRELHKKELWILKGQYNQDRTTFYVSGADKVFNQDDTLKVIKTIVEEHPETKEPVETF